MFSVGKTGKLKQREEMGTSMKKREDRREGEQKKRSICNVYKDAVSNLDVMQRQIRVENNQ
jgi:hypothetical protein